MLTATARIGPDPEDDNIPDNDGASDHDDTTPDSLGGMTPRNSWPRRG